MNFKYKPNKELIKKRNYILSPQTKNRSSLLNHYKCYSFNYRRSKTLSADIICKSLGRESVKYNLKVETKINDLVKKSIADSNSLLFIKEKPLLHCIKYYYYSVGKQLLNQISEFKCWEILKNDSSIFSQNYLIKIIKSKILDLNWLTDLKKDSKIKRLLLNIFQQFTINEE